MSEQRRGRHDETEMSARLTYFLLGGTVGALVALLFAPKAGRELRGDIADVTRKGLTARAKPPRTRPKAGEYTTWRRTRRANWRARRARPPHAGRTPLRRHRSR